MKAVSVGVLERGEIMSQVQIEKEYDDRKGFLATACTMIEEARAAEDCLLDKDLLIVCLSLAGACLGDIPTSEQEVQFLIKRYWCGRARHTIQRARQNPGRIIQMWYLQECCRNAGNPPLVEIGSSDEEIRELIARHHREQARKLVQLSQKYGFGHLVQAAAELCKAQAHFLDIGISRNELKAKIALIITEHGENSGLYCAPLPPYSCDPVLGVLSLVVRTVAQG